jgi:hypothetical protein
MRHHGECKDCRSTRCRAKYADDRRRVLKGYGGACACCGESHPHFLALDHVHGCGKANRVPLGDLMPKLIRQGFPASFRLLCHNCNFSSWAHGVCRCGSASPVTGVNVRRGPTPHVSG